MSCQPVQVVICDELEYFGAIIYLVVRHNDGMHNYRVVCINSLTKGSSNVGPSEVKAALYAQGCVGLGK